MIDLVAREGTQEIGSRIANIVGSKYTMDAFDKKRFKEGRLAFIGVKPRGDTNLKLTKEQQDLENRRRIKDTRMASKLKKLAKSKQRKPKSIET